MNELALAQDEGIKISDVRDMAPVYLQDAAVRLTKVVEVAYTSLMKVLHEIRRRELFVTFGYDTMKEWVESELGFKYRKAQQFMQIWEALAEQGGMDKSELDQYSWTKLRAVAGPVNSGELSISEARELLEQSGEHTRDGFEVLVRDTINGSKSEGGSDGEESTEPSVSYITIPLYPDQKAVWDEALEKIRTEAGRYKGDELPVSVAINHMCLSVLLSDERKMDHQLAFYVKALESAFPERVFVTVRKELAAPVNEAIDKISQMFDDIPPELREKK